MSMKELKDKLKAFRSEFGKPITKMTAEEMEREISHHETAQKAAELKAKRLEALAKAREAKKGPPTLVVKKAPVKAAPAKAVKPVKEVKPRKTAAKKVVEEYPEVSDEEVVVKAPKKVAKKGSETISDRIAKKSERSDE